MARSTTEYGVRRDYRKIDLSVYSMTERVWKYAGSTTWAYSCREAKAQFLKQHQSIPFGWLVKASFSERGM